MKYSCDDGFCEAGECELVEGAFLSAAGWYYGAFCGCGPFDRWSGYFLTKEEAEEYGKSIS